MRLEILKFKYSINKYVNHAHTKFHHLSQKWLNPLNSYTFLMTYPGMYGFYLLLEVLVLPMLLSASLIQNLLVYIIASIPNELADTCTSLLTINLWLSLQTTDPFMSLMCLQTLPEPPEAPEDNPAPTVAQEIFVTGQSSLHSLISSLSICS